MKTTPLFPFEPERPPERRSHAHIHPRLTSCQAARATSPRELTHPDVAAAFGLPDAVLPYDEIAAALVGAGLSDDAARHHVDMTRASNEGRVQSALRRDGRSTTPSTIEEFAANLGKAAAV